MKIYRYIPDDAHYRYVPRNMVGLQWWPDGIDLGRMQLFRPKSSREGGTWAYEGNCFDAYPKELSLSDFPALTLNIPIVSARALEVLSSATTLGAATAMTVDEAPYFVVQPKVIPGVFDTKGSTGLVMPEGQTFFYYRRVFDVSKVDSEFFMIKEQFPYSDLYITDRFVSAASAAGLTGTDYFELVFDEEGPVVPIYPGETLPNIRDSLDWRGRLELEYFLIHRRCEDWVYDEDPIERATCDAVARGYVSSGYKKPTYTR